VRDLLLGFRAGVLRTILAPVAVKRHHRRPPQEAAAVLVVAQTRLGDTALSLPFLAGLRHAFAHARISVVAAAYCAPLLKTTPAVDEVVEVRKWGSWLEMFRLLPRLRAAHYDIAFDMTTDYTLYAGLLAFLSGASYCVGYDSHGRDSLLHLAVTPPERAHIIDEFRALGTAIGLPMRVATPHLHLDDGIRRRSGCLLANAGVGDAKVHPLVAIHPGGTYRTQRWALSRFAEIADRIRGAYSLEVVVIGGDRDRPLIEELAGRISTKPVVIVASDIQSLVGVIDRCSLLLCNNSGPLHLATAVGTATVSTMGPTVAHRWWPRGESHVVVRSGLRCAGCDSGSCPHPEHDCMDSIRVEEVWAAVRGQIEGLTGRRGSVPRDA
jgi:lipopolysaccharide heptosyltransferase II